MDEKGRIRTIDIDNDTDELLKFANAMSLKVRCEIVKIVNKSHNCKISDIAEKLNIPLSTASFHIKALLEAGILKYATNSKRYGNEKFVVLGNCCYNIFMGVSTHADSVVRSIEIPIGAYSSFSVAPPCGITLPDEVLLSSDMPSAFYAPERFYATSLWMTSGYVEYTIPFLDYEGSYISDIRAYEKRRIISMHFTFEICAECPLYNHDHKSDITFSVNGREIFTFTVSGDYGERRGKLNPEWSHDGNTQYGLLYSVDVRYDGTYLNEKRVSDISLEDLDIIKNDTLTFRIECKKDAKHAGGFNLFGRGRGDYEQNIMLMITYKN